MTGRVVFDCMVFLQALARRGGPAAACFVAAERGECELVLSAAVLDEMADVFYRPAIRKKFLRASDDDIDAFFSRVTAAATRIEPVPAVVTLTRDTKDEKYLNLALAAGAEYVVSRDNDLLDLMTSPDPEPAAFRAAYPALRIVDPVAFLRTLRPDPPAPEAP